MVVNHVIMTSDEKNATWWGEVMSEGWYRIDHSKTVEQYGAWWVAFARLSDSRLCFAVNEMMHRYPVLIDTVIQSGGAGFVGTENSTMSILARRRVQSWRDGVVRIVKWGTLEADNH